MSSQPLTYRSAGVDLDLYEQAMDRLPAMMAKTNTGRVMPLPGGFAGLFRLFGEGRKYEDPVLISGTDGVGTKIKVAAMAQRYDTIGIDLVGMCVNDCLCLGAEPLFFLDYLALGKDNPDLIASIVKGVCDGCEQAGAALLGGETAIMPDLYAPHDFDLAGFCVGVAERSQLLDGQRVKPGNVMVGIASTGLHSNGYSLVRKIVFDHARYGIDDHVAELGQSVAEALLTPTKIYAKLVSAVLGKERASVTAIAHITGGGLADNAVRVLPEGCRLVADRKSWTPPPVFEWLQRIGNVDREEMYRVFNMGIGLVLFVDRTAVDRVQSLASGEGFKSYVVGEVLAGETSATYQG